MGRHRRGRDGTALVLTGLVLAASGTAVLLWPEPELRAEVGSVVSAPPPSPAPSSAPSSSAPSSSAPSSSAPSVTPSRTSVDRGFVPERLLVRPLGIDAPLVPEAVDGDGALGLPEDPARLAWWRGVRPGAAAGSVLVAGHVDMTGYGRGPLAGIVDLRPGDRAVLTGPGGVEATYELRGVTTVRKAAFADAVALGSGGPERLVLVTCGGAYDPDLRSWDSNVIAVLDPVG